MADPPPAEETNFIGEFDALAVQPLDRTFNALHMTATYQENVEDFPIEFQNVNFKTDDIILYESFNDIFPNPTNDDAFQNPSCLPDFLGSELGLDSSQMNPHSFCQPESQLMGIPDDASRPFNSTSEYCLGKAPVSNKLEHFPLNLGNNSVKGGVDEKRMDRKIRNKVSAHLSRQRKKHYVKELENKFRIFHSTIQHLNANLSYAMAENITLKAQLGGNGVPTQVPPPLGINPYPPPWMSYTPYYMMNRQGYQVPLVPIPKLKSQALAPAPKSNKEVEKKKSGVKTKKVVSVSFLGVLFFILLFGGLVPLLKGRYGDMREPFMSGESFVSGFYEKHHERVLTIDEPVNGTGYSGKYDGKNHSSHCGQRGQGESNKQNTNKAGDEFVHVGNGSDPLVASLYVPRNDKLVEIDGSLIIQSILASEKAMAFHGSAEKKNKEAGLAVPGDIAPTIPAVHPRLYRSPEVGQRTLGSDENENVKSTILRWYLEGVAGPLLSSGMCTEVFQFDASSSAREAIVPVTNVRDTSMEERHNDTRLHRNRRILNGPPVSLSRPSHNISEEQTGTNGKQENPNRNKSLSSLVVSVLVDGDGDGIMRPKSVSRIFVLVLIDSVKYVTNSCMLPFIDSAHVARASSKKQFCRYHKIY
ncbi:bZIP transcription factor 17-like [Solanum pennellii]|uniref:BZIP transcription factor 17-like n=1 Tax=Solanum pennellii TaxID=28526 RepID=A0ABM1VA20_SOLPN|nr:bZIP transcription factor 17-like [Solanum pennellii]